MADYMSTVTQLYEEAEKIYRAENPEIYNEVFVNTEGKSSAQIAGDVEYYRQLVCEDQIAKLDKEYTSSGDSLDVKLVEAYTERERCAEELKYINDGGGGEKTGFLGLSRTDKYGEHLNGADGLYAQLEKVRGTDAEAVIQARITALETVKAEKQAALDNAEQVYTQTGDAIDANHLKQDFWSSVRYNNDQWLEQNIGKVAAISNAAATGGASTSDVTTASTPQGTPIPKDPNDPYYTQRQFTAEFGNDPKVGSGVMGTFGATGHTFTDVIALADIGEILGKLSEGAEQRRSVLDADLTLFKEACVVPADIADLHNRRTQLVQSIEIQRGGQRAFKDACVILADFIGTADSSDTKTLIGTFNRIDTEVYHRFNDCLGSFAGVEAIGAVSGSKAASDDSRVATADSVPSGSQGYSGGSTGGSNIGSTGGSVDRKVMTNTSEILDFGQDGMSVKNGVIVGGALDGQYYKGKFYRDGNIYEADGAGNEKLVGSYDSMKNDVTISTPKGGIVDTPTGYSANAGVDKKTADKAISDLEKDFDDIMADAKPVKPSAAPVSSTKKEVLEGVSEITDDGTVIKTDKNGNVYGVDKNGDITELFEDDTLLEEDELLEDVQEFSGSGMEISEVHGTEVFSNDPNSGNAFTMENPFNEENFTGGFVDTTVGGGQPTPAFNPFANMPNTQPLSFNSTALFPEGSAGADWRGESPFTNFDVNNISDSAASALNDVGIHVIGDGILLGTGTENLVASSAELGFLSKEQVTWAANVLHQIPGAQFGNVETTTYSVEKGAFIYPINPPADFVTTLYRL